MTPSKPGLYWARASNIWNLVEVRDAYYRPDDWYAPGEPKVEIFGMGWDCPVDPKSFSEFRPANIVDPDGNNYTDVHNA